MKKILYLILNFINLYFCIIKVKDTESNTTVARFRDADAQFGGDFDDYAKAYLIESYPILACNLTIDPPPIDLPNGSTIMFVALIKRGNCTFLDKVKAAQNSGYQGVIIYNNNSDTIFRMPRPYNSSDEFIRIPSRMVGLTNGVKLKKFTFTLVRQQYIIIFSHGLEFDPQDYIIAFLGFVSLGFLLIGFGFAFKIGRDYCRRRANRLKKCHLSKIPIKKFVKGEDQFDTCAICLDDFVDGDKLRILPCNHAYHTKCIDPWLLKQKRNCPICKNKIQIPGREEESDDSNSVVVPREAGTVTIDEHTPLINPRNHGLSHSNFIYDSDTNVTGNNTGNVAQNCYDNQCAEYTVANSPVHNPRDIIINSDGGDLVVREESLSHQNKFVIV